MAGTLNIQRRAKTIQIQTLSSWQWPTCLMAGFKNYGPSESVELLRENIASFCCLFGKPISSCLAMHLKNKLSWIFGILMQGSKVRMLYRTPAGHTVTEYSPNTQTPVPGFHNTRAPIHRLQYTGLQTLAHFSQPAICANCTQLQLGPTRGTHMTKGSNHPVQSLLRSSRVYMYSCADT